MPVKAIDLYKDVEPDAAPAPANNPPGAQMFDLSPPSSQAPSDALPTASGASQAMLRSSGRLSPEQGYLQRNQQPGVPLDVHEGLPPLEYFKMKVNRLKSDQISYLKKTHGEGNVRADENGDPIIRIQDSKTGRPKEIKANPQGLDLNDFLDLAAQFPEIAAGVVAARGGAPAGLISKALQIGKMAAGSEAGGAAKDILVRESEGLPARPAEIAGSRATMAAQDAALGAGITFFSKAATKLVSPFSSPGELTFDMKAARDYFENHPVNPQTISGTPGEISGNPILLKTEAFMGQQPGSAGVFKDLFNARTKQVAKIQNVAIGLPADATAADYAGLPSEEEIGQRAIGTIGAKLQPEKSAIESEKRAIAEEGSAGLRKGAEQLSTAGPVDIQAHGESLIKRATELRNGFEARTAANYEAAYAHPLANQRNLPANGIAARAEQLLKEQPSKVVDKEVPTGVLDARGNPITRTEQTEELLPAFLPDDVVPKLKELADLKGQNFQLEKLLRMRTKVRGDIAKGEALPGVSTHYLKEIQKNLTEEINSGLDKLNDPSLKALWKKANDFHAKNAPQFEQKDIAALLKDPSQPGYIGPTRAVTRALSGEGGSDSFQAYKTFFGANSAEFKGVKRAVLDGVLGRSPYSTSNLVDPSEFLARARALYDDPATTGIAQQIFGRQGAAALDLAGTMKAAEGKVDGAELERLVTSNLGPIQLKQRLTQLISNQAKLDQLYHNKILKAIGTSSLDAEKINPSEFVDRFAFQADPKDIKQVMAGLTDQPKLVEDIRSRTVQKILDRASPSAQAIDNPALVRGTPRKLSSSGLNNALGPVGSVQRARLEALLEPSTLQDLTQLTKLLAPGEIGEKSFAVAGGLAAGTQIGGMLRKGELKYADLALIHFIEAVFYTSKPMRAYVGNNLISPQNANSFLNLAITATPVIEALRRAYGDDGATQAIRTVKSAIDTDVLQSGQPVGTSRVKASELYK